MKGQLVATGTLPSFQRHTLRPITEQSWCYHPSRDGSSKRQQDDLNIAEKMVTEYKRLSLGVNTGVI
jgi:hypothetical protein